MTDNGKDIRHKQTSAFRGGTNCEPFKEGELRANRDSSESLQFARIEIFLYKLIKTCKIHSRMLNIHPLWNHCFCRFILLIFCERKPLKFSTIHNTSLCLFLFFNIHCYALLSIQRHDLELIPYSSSVFTGT